MTFKVGDKVEWSSQAGGVERTKQGEILLVVPPGKDPFQLLFKEFDRADVFQDYSIQFSGYGRDHENYIVKVQETERSKPKLYNPLVKNLRKVEEGFKVGDRVKSRKIRQSNRVNEGVIIAIIPPNTFPHKVTEVPQDVEAVFSGAKRPDKSYIIEVIESEKKFWYHPLTERLEKIENK